MRLHEVGHGDRAAPAEYRRRQKYRQRHHENDLHHDRATITQQQIEHQHQIQIDYRQTFDHEPHPRRDIIHAVDLINVEISEDDGEEEITSHRHDQRLVLVARDGIIVGIGGRVGLLENVMEIIFLADEVEEPNQIDEDRHAEIIHEADEHIQREHCLPSCVEQMSQLLKLRRRRRQCFEYRRHDEGEHHDDEKSFERQDFESGLWSPRAEKLNASKAIREVRRKKHPQPAHEIHQSLADVRREH